MKTEIEIVNELMSKYGVTNKDLFSFCICAVNFKEYYFEESMVDMMSSCPKKYYSCDSDNTRAVAGALAGEKKKEGWTDVDQFIYYIQDIQEAIRVLVEDDESDNKYIDHFLNEYQRFEKVYRREILVPFMIGCPIEEYDDSKFYDRDYIKSIINVENQSINNVYQERRKAEFQKYLEKEEEKMAKVVEMKKDDKDFTVLLASCTDVTKMKDSFEKYNKTYYPDRGYKILPFNKPNLMIIQTGGKSIEEVKEVVLDIVHSRLVILGCEMHEELIPVETAFKGNVPEDLVNHNVTHVVTHFF